MKFRENILDGIRVMERTQMMEAQTDEHSNFRRGEHNTFATFLWRDIKSVNQIKIIVMKE